MHLSKNGVVRVRDCRLLLSFSLTWYVVRDNVGCETWVSCMKWAVHDRVPEAQTRS